MYIVKSLGPPSFYYRQHVKSLVRSTMVMGLWIILLVPFVILMMVIGVGGGMRERMKKWEVAHTMERKRRSKTERKPKRTPHPCGNVTRQEVEGVEPPNLFAPIVKRHRQVHILV